MTGGCRHAYYHACMAQLTIRLSEDLAKRLKAAATRRGVSMNAWVGAVLRAAVDPAFEGDEAERTRERLRLAGLLPTEEPAPRHRPPRRKVAEARRAAATGQPLSDLVNEGRR